MGMWSRIKADAPTAFIGAVALLIVTTAFNAIGKAYGWLTTPPKHGPAPLMAPITVPLWALLASVAVFVLWLAVAALRPKTTERQNLDRTAPPYSGSRPPTPEEYDRTVKLATDSRQQAVKERDNAQLEAAAALHDRNRALSELNHARARIKSLEEEIEKLKQPDVVANLRAEITGFEMVDANDIPKDDFDLLWKASSYGAIWVGHLEIENLGSPTRTKDWQFTLLLGNEASDRGPLVESKKWPPPSSWPKIQYTTLDEVQNEYIQPGKAYHVLFFLRTSVLSSQFNSLEIRFTDGEGREIAVRRERSAVQQPARHLSAYEAEKKLRVVDAAISILRDDMESTVTDFSRLDSGWHNAIVVDGPSFEAYFSELRAYRDAIRQNIEKLKSFRAKNTEFADIVAITDQANVYDRMFAETDSFIGAVHLCSSSLKVGPPEPGGGALAYLMRPFEQAFSKAFSEFTKWRDSGISSLIALRRQLSP